MLSNWKDDLSDDSHSNAHLYLTRRCLFPDSGPPASVMALFQEGSRHVNCSTLPSSRQVAHASALCGSLKHVLLLPPARS